MIITTTIITTMIIIMIIITVHYRCQSRAFHFIIYGRRFLYATISTRPICIMYLIRLSIIR
jgi:hypothetical protein